MSFNPLEYPLCLKEPRFLSDVLSWQEHIPFAFSIMQMLKPKMFVELGTHKGDSYLAFCQAVDTLDLPTACHAVDSWEGDTQAGFYDNTIYNDLKTYHDKHYGRFSELHKSYFDDALGFFSDKSIDLLHIDGLHTYEAVKHDFESWLPKVSGDGVVLFHDTNVREGDFGVWRFFEEVAAQYPAFEFKHCNGLGVIAVGSTVPQPLKDLLTYGQQHPEELSDYFHSVGCRISLSQTVKSLGEQLSVQGQQFAELVHQVSLKDGYILELEQLRTQRDQQLQEKELSLAEFEKELFGLRGQLEETNGQLTQRDTELSEATRSKAELAELLSEKNRQLVERDLLLRERERVSAEQEQRIQDLINSLSWKVTAPLRSVYGLVKK